MAVAVPAGSESFTVEHFCDWARGLVLDDGEPWVVEDWQAAFVGDVFSGFAESWLLVPEGNGKTTLLAGLALYHAQFRLTAWVPIAASSRDQAEVMYRQAEGFVFRSSQIRGVFKCQEGYRRIKCLANGSRIQVFAADDRTGDGVIPTLCLIDELHRHRDLRLYRTWRGKLMKRGGQIVAISTAGEPGGEFEEARLALRAGAMREGSFLRVETDTTVLHDWSVPDDEDVTDSEVVKRANPFGGVTVEALAEKFSSPTMTLPHWRRFVCNWPEALKTGVFLPLEVWSPLAVPEMVVEEGSRVCLGADGSRTFDTTVVAWASLEGEKVLVGARVFSVRREVAHHVLHLGGSINFDDVEAFILDRFDYYTVLEAAYDPRYLERSAEIMDMRLPNAALVPVEPVSKHMREALQTFEQLCLEGKLVHNGDPVLTAHLANCGVERGERGEIRRVKKIDPKRPIDAVPALALAVWRAVQADPGGPMIAFM